MSGPASGTDQPTPEPAGGAEAVEAALFEHPGIGDCAVVPDPRADGPGPAWTAVVILRPGTKVTAEELARHVADRLGRSLVPGRFWLRQAPLPKDPSGVLLRAELRAELGGGPTPGPTGRP